MSICNFKVPVVYGKIHDLKEPVFLDLFSTDAVNGDKDYPYLSVSIKKRYNLIKRKMEIAFEKGYNFVSQAMVNVQRR
jgi:hypothetical protein